MIFTTYHNFILYKKVSRYIFFMKMISSRLKTNYILYFSDNLLTLLARNNAFWRHFCNYFPIKLVKTVDLNPNKSYFFISVPHGILSAGIMGSFGTDILGCKKLFPGLEIRTIILDQHFKAPLFREYCLFLGKNF